jgi:hypothetical protein
VSQVYTRTVDRYGPRSSLFSTTSLFALLLFIAGISLAWVDDYVEDYPLYHGFSQVISSFIFVAEDGLVQLLYSQHWSFMGSVQSKEESAVWFAPIAGMGAMASTLAGMVVSPLVSFLGGLPHLWCVASLFMLACAFCADQAYQIAEQVRTGRMYVYMKMWLLHTGSILVWWLDCFFDYRLLITAVQLFLLSTRTTSPHIDEQSNCFMTLPLETHSHFGQEQRHYFVVFLFLVRCAAKSWFASVFLLY